MVIVVSEAVFFFFSVPLSCLIACNIDFNQYYNEVYGKLEAYFNGLLGWFPTSQYYTWLWHCSTFCLHLNCLLNQSY